MQGQQLSIDATKAALNSYGSAVRENEKYQQSLEARINKMKNAWTELALAMGDAVITDSIIYLTEVLSDVAKLGTLITNNFGVLPVVFGSVATAAALLSKNFRTLTIAVITLGKGIHSLGVSARAATAALRSLGAATVVGAVFVAIGFALEKLINYYGDLKEKQEELEHQNKTIVDSYTNRRDRINELLKSYEELNSKTSLTAEQEEEYYRITNELGSLLPNLIDHIDEKGRVHLKTGKALQREIEYTKELTEATLRLKRTQAIEDFERNKNERDEQIDEIEDLEKRIQKQREYIDNLKKAKEEQEKLGYQTSYTITDEDIENAQNELSELNLKLVKAKNNLHSLSAESSTVLKTLIDGLAFEEEVNFGDGIRRELFKVIDAIDLTNVKSEELEGKALDIVNAFKQSESIDEFINKLREMYQQDEEVIESLDRMQDSLKRQENALSNGLIPVFNDAGDYLFNVKDVSELVTKGFKDIQTETDDTTGQIERFIITGKKLDKLFKDVGSEIAELNNVIYDLNESQSLSSEQVLDLLEKYPDLIDATHKTADGYTIEKDALELLRKQIIQTKVDTLESQSLMTDSTFAELNKRMEYYGIEAEALMNLATAKKALEEKFPEQPEWVIRMRQDWDWAALDQEKADRAMLKEHIKRLEQIEKLKELLRDPNFGVSRSSSRSRGKTPEEKAAEAREKAYREELRELENKYNKEQITINEYIDGLKRMTVAHKQYLKENRDAEIEHHNKIFNLSKERNQKAYQDDLKYWENRYNRQEITIQQYIDGLKQMEEVHKNYLKTNEDAEIAHHDKIMSLINERKRKAFEHSENWIENERKRMEMAGASEIEIAQMILDARIRMAKEEWAIEKGIVLTAQEKLDLAYAVYEAEENLNKLLKKQEEQYKTNYEQMKKNLEDAIDNAIDAIKEYYKRQKELALDAIDKERESLEELHKERINKLNEELDKYEEIINARLKLIDQQEDERDFNKELAKAQEEVQKIRSKIAIKSLDDSYESQAEVRRLEEELAKKLEEIDEMKHSRQIELRKQNLRDNLEAKRKEIEAEKENAKYTIEINGQIYRDTYNNLINFLELEREETKRHWDEILNNEREFNRLREEALKGNIDVLNGMLLNFANDIENNMVNVGISIQNNLIDKLREASKELMNFYDNYSSAKVDYDNYIKDDKKVIGGTNKNKSEKDIAHEKYLYNKVEWYQIYKETGRKDTERQKQLNKYNEYYRKLYGFKDYTPQDLKEMGLIASLDTGGYTGEFSGGKLGILHEKELVLNKFDTSNLLKTVQITRDLFRQFKIPNLNFPKLATATGGDKIINLNISIDRIIGNEDGGKKVFNTIVKHLQKNGL